MASRSRIAAAGLALAWIAVAQDIDTFVLSGDRKPFTYLDQISDQAEKQAFLSIVELKVPSEKYRASLSFLDRFGRSWLRAFAYEAAAKSALDLGDDESALRHARQSLRLYPENPILLVPVARLHVSRQNFDQALTTAREALALIERFGRPSTIDSGDWPKLRAALEAEAHTIAGRAALTLAIDRKNDATLVNESAAHLIEAARLDPASVEVAAMLKLFNKLPKPPRKNVSNARQPDYAGSDACRGCHASEHTNWSHTGMSRMLQRYQPSAVAADFTRPSPSPGITPKLEKGKHLFEIATPSGPRILPVTHVIGSKWQQAFASLVPGGQIHVFPIQFNMREKAWINYWASIDPPGSPRANPANFHRLTDATNYMVNCAPCHTSQLKGRTTADLRFREEGVNCEQCHGPSGRHVEQMKTGRPYQKRAIDAPVEFRKIAAGDYVAICAQCHAQSRLNELAPSGEVNYRESGDTFFARYPSRPLVEFSRRAFYKDGRFRETTFIVEAFLRTKCFKVGQATCGSCHNPHPADAAGNPTSLKFTADSDQMCRQCHKAHPTAHDAKTTDAIRCVECHMPRIMNSVLFSARSHQIDDIPDAAMTTRFGQQESPSACLMCHSGKDEQWLLKR